MSFPCGWILGLFPGLCFAIGYIWVFYVLRRPVLAQIWGRWPTPLDEWFRGIPQRVPRFAAQPEPHRDASAASNSISKRIRRFVAAQPFVSWYLAKGPRASRQPVNRFRDGSAQESLLRAAMNEFFHARELGAGAWNQGLGHWIIYWCTPVWLGYLALLFFLLPAATSHKCPSFLALTFSAVAWALLSIVFLIKQIRFMSSPEWGVNAQHLKRLPPQVQHLFEPISRLPDLVGFLSVRGVLGVLQTLAFSVYLFLINLVRQMS